MLVIYILSFQGPEGGLTFPLRGVSTRWFNELISNGRSGDIAGTFTRRSRWRRWLQSLPF